MSAASVDPFEPDDVLDVDEVTTLLADLSPTEWMMLRRTADALGRRIGRRDREDILQEACLRMIQGSRKVRGNRSLYHAIAGVMRSLVSAEIDALEGGRRPALVAPEWLALHPDHRLSVERSLIDRQQCTKLLDRIFAALADDPMLIALADAELDGVHGKVLCRHLSITTGQLATLKRKLARRLAGLQQAFAAAIR